MLRSYSFLFFCKKVRHYQSCLIEIKQHNLWLCGKFLSERVDVCCLVPQVDMWSLYLIQSPPTHTPNPSNMQCIGSSRLSTAKHSLMVLRVNPSASRVRRRAPLQNNPKCNAPSSGRLSFLLFWGGGGAGSSCKLRFVVSAGTAGRTSTAVHCDA